MSVVVDDTKWRKLLAVVGQLGTREAKVGILQDATVPDSDGLSVVELAAIHEFGSPAANIPERSFIRSTFTAKRHEGNKLAERLAKAIVLRGMPTEQALGLLGSWGAAAVKATITSGDGVPPPLAAATIARKGASRALVDTGQLVNSITSAVGEPDEGDL